MPNPDSIKPNTGLKQVRDALASLAQSYDGTDSFQAIGVDLELDADAGSTSTDPKFLAALMGTLTGNALTKEGAYLAGVIAALSVTGARATEWQVGALLGVIMDGVTDADGAVVAVLDGSDPSAVTRANAAFAARVNNNDAGSGFDYGLDLYDPGRDDLFSAGDGIALAVDKAVVRSPNQVCWLEGSGVPVDGTTGTGFSAKGSMYVDVASGEWYINTGTIAASVWKAVTHAA